jgi:hypothetical protein
MSDEVAASLASTVAAPAPATAQQAAAASREGAADNAAQLQAAIAAAAAEVAAPEGSTEPQQASGSSGNSKLFSSQASAEFDWQLGEAAQGRAVQDSGYWAFRSIDQDAEGLGHRRLHRSNSSGGSSSSSSGRTGGDGQKTA